MRVSTPVWLRRALPGEGVVGSRLSLVERSRIKIEIEVAALKQQG